jgi:hypothetical protein
MSRTMRKLLDYGGPGILQTVPQGCGVLNEFGRSATRGVSPAPRPASTQDNTTARPPSPAVPSSECSVLRLGGVRRPVRTVARPVRLYRRREAAISPLSVNPFRPVL